MCAIDELHEPIVTDPPGPRSAGISVASLIDADAAAIWDRVTVPEGINDEMRPFMRMTIPPGVERLDPDNIVLGERIGRSWVLLFGVIPFDYDDLTLVELEPGSRFLERSRMLSQRVWEHERTIEPGEDGRCLVTDRIRWEPRLPVPGKLLRPLFRWFFGHRHSRLRRHFGGSPA